MGYRAYDPNRKKKKRKTALIVCVVLVCVLAALAGGGADEAALKSVETAHMPVPSFPNLARVPVRGPAGRETGQPFPPPGLPSPAAHTPFALPEEGVVPETGRPWGRALPSLCFILLTKYPSVKDARAPLS